MNSNKLKFIKDGVVYMDAAAYAMGYLRPQTNFFKSFLTSKSHGLAAMRHRGTYACVCKSYLIPIEDIANTLDKTAAEIQEALDFVECGEDEDPRFCYVCAVIRAINEGFVEISPAEKITDNEVFFIGNRRFKPLWK